MSNNLCDNLMYHVRILLYRFYQYYDDLVNPPCHACGVKKTN